MNWLREFFQSSYTRLLERQCAELKEECARLRAENRALMNSLLGTAGFPPMEFPEAPKPSACGGPRLRKRSWHQIQAWRETEAARDRELNFEDRTETRTNGPVSHS